jgi:hypothetical protein
VFQTSTGGGYTGYDKGKKKLDQLIEEHTGAVLAPWRLHDLRRTLATGFQRLGIRFEVTEAVLNHVGGSRAGVAGMGLRAQAWKSDKPRLSACTSKCAMAASFQGAISSWSDLAGRSRHIGDEQAKVRVRGWRASP